MADKFTAEVGGAGDLTRDFLRAAAELRRDMNRTVGEIADDAVIIYQGFAPKRRGRLIRGIKARVVGSTAFIEAHAVNKKTGYDYVGVTRFGHRVDKIVPIKAKALGPIPGIGFRKSVKGFKPASDWAEDAWPEIKAEAETAMEKLGREFLVNIG